MKLRLLPTLAVALVALAVPALAQNANPPEAPPAQTAPAGGHMHGLRAAFAALNLTSDQQAQLAKIMAQAKEARENGQPIDRADLMKQINGVLTPAQRTQLQAEIEKQRAARQAAAAAAAAASPAPQK